MMNIPSGYKIIKESEIDVFFSKTVHTLEELRQCIILSYADMDKVQPFIDQGFAICFLYAFTKERITGKCEFWDFKVCYHNDDLQPFLGQIALEFDSYRDKKAFLAFKLDLSGKEFFDENILRAFIRWNEALEFEFAPEISGNVREQDYVSADPFLKADLPASGTGKREVVSYRHASFPETAFCICADAQEYTVYPGKLSFSTLHEAYEDLIKNINTYRLKGLFV